MANGLFNLKQVMQGIQQGGWQGAALSTYSASFNTTTLQYLTTVLSSALSGQFTVEFWYKRYSSGNTTLITIGDSSLSTGIEFYIGSGGSNNTLYSNNATQISSTAFPFGTWNHIAFTRDGSNVIRLFINGNVVGSTYTSSATFSSSVRIGVEYYGSSVSAAGSASISNVRILNGTCLYTTNFAVPTSPLTNITNTALLTLQNATIVDNSSSALSITNTGTVATVVDSGMFSPNSKTPAVEYLVVAGGGTGRVGGGGAGGLLTGVSPVPNGQTLLVTLGAGGSGGGSNWGFGSATSGSNSVFGSISATGGGMGGQYAGVAGGSGGGGGSPSSDPGIAGGTGIAGQGNSGGASYTNSGTSGSDGGGGGGAGTVGLTAPAVLGNGGNGGAGVASVITGTVSTYAGGGGGGGYSTAGSGGIGGGGNGTIYNGDATSGTANTGGGGGGAPYSLGRNGAGGSGIVVVSYPDTYAAPTATTGSPTVSTSGSGSISFNGSSQYLSTSATQVIPATGDFTIEAWIYPTSFSGSPVFCGQGSAGDAGRTLFFISTGGVPTFSNGSSFTFTSTGTVSLNTWTYIAFTRSGSTGTWYINGASAGTGSLSGITVQNTFVTIGGSNPLWTAQYFTGYISNFRISTVARTITSTPTAPFNPSTSNTKMLLLTASGAFLADASTNAYTFTNNGTSTWNQLSPFATGTGYKNRVYTWTTSGSITF